MKDIDEKTSDSARAITKGLKKKEMDDMQYGIAIFFSLIGSIILGIVFKNFIVGIIAFFVLGGLAWKKWYKE